MKLNAFNKVAMRPGGALPKILFVMRITIFILLSALMQVSAAGYAQRITLSEKKSSLRNVIDKIRQQSGYDFIFIEESLKNANPVNINVKNVTLEESLKQIFANQSLQYELKENVVVITPKTESLLDKVKSYFVDIEVTGRVLDEAGLPLPGATVKLKGTKQAVSTNNNGVFAITVPDEKAILEVTFMGYLPMEIVVGTQKNVLFELKPTAATDLNEVAVVAFGTQKKESLVGAQSSVKASELQQPVANISSMLAGRLPGVIAVNRTGEPGSDRADIWIRGISNIGGDRSPLIIVDGVPDRPIDGLSAYDIESFTILKDAAATAVYGIRGANGVILVNTKRGKLGPPAINFDYFQGITGFTKKPELIDGVDYMNLANEGSFSEFVRTGSNGVFNPRYSAETIAKTASGEDRVLYPNVDWLDEVFKDFGQNRTVTANMTGGVNNAKYYVSLGYYDETGLFKTDENQTFNSKQKYSRYNVSTNLDWDITPTTKMNLGLKGILGQGNYPGPENAQGVFNQAFQITPVSFPVLYPDGSIPGISGQGDQRNPFADVTRRGYRTTFNTRLFSNLRITQDLKAITEGLSLTGMFSFDVNNNNNVNRNKRENTYYINPAQAYNPDGSYKYNQTFTGQNYLGFSTENGGDKKLYTEVALNYNRTFGKHSVSALAVYNQNDNANAFVSNFTLSIPYRLQGVASRIAYSYDNKYFAEVNAGYNGSENFAPDRRYGFFPAFGVGWILSNEKFFEPLKNAFQLVKFRYSDGIVGSGGSTSGYAGNESDRFYYLTKVGNSGGYTFGQTRNVAFNDGLNVTAYGVDISWAETRKQDLGFEFKTLDNTLSVIVDLFKEHRTGIFLGRGLVPNYIGLVSNPSGNLGETKNKGIDATLEYIAKFSSEFDVTFRANYTHNKDKIIENDQAPTAFPYMELRGSNILARSGYIADGLFTSQEEINASPTQFGKLLPGDIKYKDLNSDGRIDAFDRTIIGRGDVPTTMYGFGFAARYKGFDLGAFFQGQFNADILLGGDAVNAFTASAGASNLHAFAMDRWTVDNPRQDAAYPRLSYGVNDNNYQASTWWLRDISFLRLKNVDLGYTLNKGINAVGVKKLRVYFTGYNLVTFSKFKLWDPELASNNGTKYPLISTYSLGLTANF